MLPLSLCRQWQPDRAANTAQDSRSYTTAWGTIITDTDLEGVTMILRRLEQFWTDAGHHTPQSGQVAA
jgi:hypothetical protein